MAIMIVLCLPLGGANLVAATVLLRDEAEPVRGILLEENERGVRLRVVVPDGPDRERFIPRESIDVILRPVDGARLAALTPEQPSGYRDYAEELAEKRVDPEARETSIRLYLIAAHLAPEELGRSALLGMAPLARSEGERRRFRAMAFLLDPERNPRLLQGDGSSKVANTDSESIESPQVAVLRRALEMLRRGRQQEANRLIRRAGVAEALEEHADLLTLDQFLEACGDRLPRGPEPPPELLARILRLELRLLGEAPQASSPHGGLSLKGRWKELPPEVFQKNARELNLKTLTEFDPGESLFRAGTWVSPDGSAKGTD